MDDDIINNPTRMLQRLSPLVPCGNNSPTAKKAGAWWSARADSDWSASVLL